MMELAVSSIIARGLLQEPFPLRIVVAAILSGP
jgi:hypothetical protein